jgi:hypothetical protein
MSSAKKTLDPNDPQLAPHESGGTLFKVGLGLGVVGLGGAAAVGATQHDHWSGFLHSYLIAFCYFLAIALGGLFFVTLQHLVRAGWSVVVRRIAEFIAGALPWLAVLSLPIIIPTVMGNHALYEWADATIRANDHILHHKEPYLNNTFFLIRMVVYFGFWSLLARYLLKTSVAQDENGDVAFTKKLERVAPGGMVLLALTLSYGVFDLVMSLMPHWFSTMLGIYFFAGAALSSLAVMILIAKFLHSKGRLQGIFNVEHYHDVGKLMFAFNFFWAYVAFSQFMLIWYANMPEGTMFFKPRMEGQWAYFSIAMVAIHFVIPFIGFMSRYAKRNTGILTFWALWLLGAHYMDMFFLIKPTLISIHGMTPGMLHLSLTDPLCWIGMFGFFVAAIGRGIQKYRLVPARDPRISESLAFENY